MKACQILVSRKQCVGGRKPTLAIGKLEKFNSRVREQSPTHFLSHLYYCDWLSQEPEADDLCLKNLLVTFINEEETPRSYKLVYTD